MRVAGYKRLVVRKRYPCNTFEENVTVDCFKNEPPKVFCKKKELLKILPASQENTALKSIFNKFAGLRT